MRLFLSNRAIKELKAYGIQKVQQYESNNFCWRLDFIPEFRIFIATNETTLFTKLFSSFVGLSEIVNSLFPSDKNPIEVLVSPNRRIIGSMLEMRKVIEYYFDTIPNVDLQNIEEDINNLVYSFINYSRPVDEHKKLK